MPGRADSEGPLRSWYKLAKQADWRHFADVRNDASTASQVGERTVFNIGGNRYRLIVYIDYRFGVIQVRHIGTHAEYDRVDVRGV